MYLYSYLNFAQLYTENQKVKALHTNNIITRINCNQALIGVEKRKVAKVEKGYGGDQAEHNHNKYKDKEIIILHHIFSLCCSRLV